MKISIRNLGPIHEKTEIDLKPLTILIGPNNMGKTWLAYVLGGIFGNYGSQEYGNAYIKERVEEKYSILEDAITILLDKGSTTIDLIQFIENNGESYFNSVAKFARVWMRDFMGTEKVDFASLELSLKLDETKKQMIERILHTVLEGNLSVGRGKHKPLLTFLKEKGKREIYIYSSLDENTTNDENVIVKLPSRIVREFVLKRFFNILHEALYTYVQFFPTERAFFATFPPTRVEKLIPTKESSQDLSFIETKAKPAPGYLGEFIRMLVTLFESNLDDRKRSANSTQSINEYIKLSQILEQNILGGSIDFSIDIPDPRRTILFNTTEEVLDMPVASSMVKELASLVLYLRYSVDPGELLIIDEPEMNLHPKAQAQIIEFLAMLVNSGLHILVTTHSPYIIDHLANLIKANEHPDKETIRTEFFLQDTRAFIPQNKVSAYKVEGGKVENIIDEDGILNWGTFGDVSNRIIDIYGNL